MTALNVFTAILVIGGLVVWAHHRVRCPHEWGGTLLDVSTGTAHNKCLKCGEPEVREMER